jgi:hypothetical protein
MIPVETVLRIRGGCVGDNRGRNSNIVYLIHSKNLCKCYNVFMPSTTIKNKEISKKKRKKNYSKIHQEE